MRGTPIDRLDVGAYTVPTDQPEADGTLAWDSTTLVVVHARGGGRAGLGYTYADVTAARLIAANPDRLVWGSDWPHLMLNGVAVPDAGAQLNALLDVLPAGRARRRVR